MIFRFRAYSFRFGPILVGPFTALVCDALPCLLCDLMVIALLYLETILIFVLSGTKKKKSFFTSLFIEVGLD